MNFVIVPANQAMVNVRITEYPDESDPGPFPIPSNAPIENWPLARNEDTRRCRVRGSRSSSFSAKAPAIVI